MFYLRPRKIKKPKSGWYVVHRYDSHVEYCSNHEKVDEYLDFLEDELNCTPERMAKIRVYPALSWRVRNVFVDEDGDVRFGIMMAGILLISAIVSITTITLNT